MPVSPGSDARTNVGLAGCGMIVPNLSGPSGVKVKSGGRNQVGIFEDWEARDFGILYLISKILARLDGLSLFRSCEVCIISQMELIICD